MFNELVVNLAYLPLTVHWYVSFSYQTSVVLVFGGSLSCALVASRGG